MSIVDALSLATLKYVQASSLLDLSSENSSDEDTRKRKHNGRSEGRYTPTKYKRLKKMNSYDNKQQHKSAEGRSPQMMMAAKALLDYGVEEKKVPRMRLSNASLESAAKAARDAAAMCAAVTAAIAGARAAPSSKLAVSVTAPVRARSISSDSSDSPASKEMREFGLPSVRSKSRSLLSACPVSSPSSSVASPASILGVAPCSKVVQSQPVMQEKPPQSFAPVKFSFGAVKAPPA